MQHSTSSTVAPLVIDIGARSSPLSQMQAKEVLTELNRFHPHVIFRSHYMETKGDLDQKTSLRTLDRTNFFTKEVDEYLLAGKCRVGIHSAKDLPHPLPKGIDMAALTTGVDNSDVLVMRPGDTLETLRPGAVIATSSERREEIVRGLRSDFQFIDLRGNIGQRLTCLQTGKADGVVIAEAALIRLKMTNLNRIKLPGPTADYQGQLAILIREDDDEMRELFACLDSRKRVLYLGTEAPAKDPYRLVTHCPLIQIQPRAPEALKEAFNDYEAYTHFIFTSKNAVDTFFARMVDFNYHTTSLRNKELWAIGTVTADRLNKYGVQATQVAEEETQEGLVDLMKNSNLKEAYFFWPHSALSRPVLCDYFEKIGVRYSSCILYDTQPLRPQTLPNLKDFDEIVFTSPSTVEAFIQFYGKLPRHKVITPQGPITKEALAAHLFPLP